MPHDPGMDWRQNRSVDQARRLVLRELAGQSVQVYLFGSWATGRATRTSDIDVAVLGAGPIPGDVLSRLREGLEESTVVYPVDVVDLAEVDDSFRARVFTEGVPWSE